MKKGIVIIVLVLALMEGVSWWVYTSFDSRDGEKPEKSFGQEQSPVSRSVPVSINTSDPRQETSRENIPEVTEEQSTPSPVSLSALPPKGLGSDFANFPPPSTEVVNGRTERTIHMGVRQYAWEPATITAKKGELVRLIVHNADVLHGLVIPDLGVNQDIPSDGGVVEFTASKAGTFEFFCSGWCGEGHMEMRGKIVIQ